jgi:hypothetical protein
MGVYVDLLFVGLIGVVWPKLSEKKSWEKGEAYSQTPEARLRQPEPRREESSGAGAKPEQPVCE